MSRTTEEIGRLFAYNRWANARTLDSASGLDAEEYGRSIGGSFGSLKDTLAHIYGAEWLWLERWRGLSPRALPSAQQASTLEVLREKWSRLESERDAFLAGLTPRTVEQVVQYVNFAGETWRYPLEELLVHLVNHSTYHRGQAATLLRQLGKKPQPTDYLLFLDAR